MNLLVKKKPSFLLSEIIETPLKSINKQEWETGKAAFTHYLQNRNSKKYKTAATEFLKRYLEESEKTDSKNNVEALLTVIKPEAVPFSSPKSPAFTFIDLFAGIGGFRMAMQKLGGKCVFTSEWDRFAQKTYAANYGKIPFGDITSEKTKQFIPDGFDILCAGFPCQAFSIAGKRGGFEDTRGTLFFDVAEIIRRKKPKAVLLENVKGLINHDRGKTLTTILRVLRDDLGYYVPEPQILNAKNYGVPQNRERIFIVGFRKDLNINSFKYPETSKVPVYFESVKEENPVPAKYYLSTQYLKTLKEHKARHAAKGNGFGYEIIPDEGISNAVVCGGMGRERNLVFDDRITNFTPTTHIKGEVNREGIRKMTPREWARLQGFPDEFMIPVADASAYKQFGNSVAVPVIEAMGKMILKSLNIKTNRLVKPA